MNIYAQHPNYIHDVLIGKRWNELCYTWNVKQNMFVQMFKNNMAIVGIE